MSIECRYCHEYNIDTAKVCISCGAKIFSGSSNSDGPIVGWVIVCPKCGKAFNVQDENAKIFECDRCDDEFDKHEIASVKPIQKFEESVVKNEQNQTIPLMTLYEIKYKREIKIKQDGIIGREGDIDQSFFLDKLHVSRHQCSVFYKDGQWRIKHLSDRVPTRINANELEQESSIPIHDGDCLKFGNLFFKTSIKKNRPSCDALVSEQSESETTNVTTEKSADWEITCPSCGKKYYGKSETFRIDVCISSSCRSDDIEKRKIADVLARRSTH